VVCIEVILGWKSLIEYSFEAKAAELCMRSGVISGVVKRRQKEESVNTMRMLKNEGTNSSVSSLA
jgi:hypothetical protein